ncbi:MAG: gluconate 2-dehydrogenase subunit 3 family protein [Bryobacteraceae bacterium]
MSDTSRRELLRNIGVSLTLTGTGAGVVSVEAAQHVHQAVQEQKSAAKGVYKPKCFNSSEYLTLQTLAGLIVPADEKSKGALEAGAPEFIDLLAANNAELAAIYTGGIAWLDRQMRKRYSAPFAVAQPDQQTAMLDLIAYRKNTSPELAPGIRFFSWVRNMTVDAFYTSRIGMDDLGYQGNSAMSQFSVPAEAIDYAVKRSGL